MSHGPNIPSIIVNPSMKFSNADIYVAYLAISLWEDRAACAVIYSELNFTQPYNYPQWISGLTS